MNKKYGFEIIQNEPDWKVFRTSCDCMHPNDDCWVDIEYDRECNMVSMEFTIKTNPSIQHNFYRYNFLKRLYIKFKLMFKILFNRSIEYESSFIFRGLEHIENFTDLITELGRNCKKETNQLEEMKKELDKFKHRNK